MSDTTDDLRAAVNETSGTAGDTLRKALMRAEDSDWRGVIVLSLSGDNGSRFLKSAGLNDMEVVGLLHWGMLIAEEQTMEDLTEPEEAL